MSDASAPPLLAQSIASTVSGALQASSDEVIRLEVPHDWPVATALATVREEYPDLRVGILRPFSNTQFADLEDPKSDVPSEITAWRNTLSADDSDQGGLAVVGDAAGPEESGLQAMPTVIRSGAVFAEWEESVTVWLDSLVNSDTPQYFFRDLFEFARDGQVDATDLDGFIISVADSGSPLSSIRFNLWMLSLLPDQMALDSDKTLARLELNYETRQFLSSSADTAADVRKLERLEDAAAEGHQVARLALKYRKTLNPEDLDGADLETIREVISSTSRPPRDHKKKLDLLDFLDEASEKLGTDAIVDVLGTISRDFALHGDEEQELVCTVQFGDDDAAELEVSVRAIDADAFRWVPSSEQEDDQEETSQTLVLLVPKESDKDYLAARTASKHVRADVFRETAEAQDGQLDASVFAPLVEDYITARQALADYERWFRYSAFELLVLLPELRQRTEAFLASWRALVDEVTSRPRPDTAYIRQFVAMLEAAWGSDEEDESPTWCVLGPLHPYMLDPLLRIASYVVESIGERDIGSRAGWALDRSTPAYRAIWARDVALYLSRQLPAVTFESDPSGGRPTASGGNGLVQVGKSYVGFHPYAKDALVLTLINPPRGKAVPASLRQLSRYVGKLRVYVVSTGGDFAPLTDAEEDIHFLGKFSSVEDWLRDAPTRSHVSVFFTDYAAGREHLSSEDGGYAPGAHVSPRIDVRPSSVLTELGTMVPYVTFEPREGNVPVIRQQQLGTSSDSRPRAFEVAPVLRESDETEIASIAQVSDWITIAAPAPLGLIAPRSIQSLTYLGKESLGPYGLFVYATSLFAVRKLVTEHLRDSPVAPSPEELEGRLAELAMRAANGVLRLGQPAGTRLTEHIGLIVANELASVIDES